MRTHNIIKKFFFVQFFSLSAFVFYKFQKSSYNFFFYVCVLAVVNLVSASISSQALSFLRITQLIKAIFFKENKKLLLAEFMRQYYIMFGAQVYRCDPYFTFLKLLKITK